MSITSFLRSAITFQVCKRIAVLLRDHLLDDFIPLRPHAITAGEDVNAVNHGDLIGMSRTKLSTRLTLSCNFTSQIKEHLGWNAAGTFPPHCDFLEARHENPPSLLNRTTLGAAYSPTRRRSVSPPDHAQFLVDCIVS